MEKRNKKNTTMRRILLNFIKACMSLKNNIMQMADCVFVFAVFAFIDAMIKTLVVRVFDN